AKAGEAGFAAGVAAAVLVLGLAGDATGGGVAGAEAAWLSVVCGATFFKSPGRTIINRSAERCLRMAVLTSATVNPATFATRSLRSARVTPRCKSSPIP